MVKQQSEGDMQCNAWYWGCARSNLPPGCLWRLWQSASILTELFRPDGNSFCGWISCSLSELVKLLRLSPIVIIISWNIVSGSLVVNPTVLAFLLSSCSFSIAVLESSTYYLATSVSLNIILHQLYFLFVAKDICFSSSLYSMLLFELQASQCLKRSYSFCFQAVLPYIHMNISFCGMLCRHAIFAHWKRQTLLFWSINHCCCTWLYCEARSWMLEDMNNMKESCVFNVNVYPFGELEQSIVCDWTITNIGRVMLTVQHRLVFGVCFRWDAWDFAR